MKWNKITQFNDADGWTAGCPGVLGQIWYMGERLSIKWNWKWDWDRTKIGVVDCQGWAVVCFRFFFFCLRSSRPIGILGHSRYWYGSS